MALAATIYDVGREAAVQAATRAAEWASTTAQTVGSLWQTYKPTTPLGWTVRCPWFAVNYAIYTVI